MTLPIYNIANHIKWVFFDLDDTLWDFTANSLDTLSSLYKDYKYLSEIFQSFDNFANQYHIINDHLWSLYQQAKVDSDTVKRDRFRLLLQPALDHFEATQCAEILQHEYLNRLAEHTLLVDGALDVLKALSEKYSIGILSNGFHDVQHKKLENSGLSPYIERMILSDEIGINKPDERIFHYAEKVAGTQPTQTLMIGDNLSADIAGAKNAGWEAVYFRRHKKDSVTDDTPVITSLRQLKG